MLAALEAIPARRREDEHADIRADTVRRLIADLQQGSSRDSNHPS